jgi:hypothetical protein
MSNSPSVEAPIIVPFPYCSVLGEKTLAFDTLSTMSDLVIQATVAYQREHPEYRIGIIGEFDPTISLDTAQLLHARALELGAPADKIDLIDWHGQPEPNSTRAQMRAIARGLGNITAMTMDYHALRTRQAGTAFGVAVTCVSAEATLRALPPEQIPTEQLVRAAELTNKLEPSERMLLLAEKVGLGWVLDLITKHYGPRYIDAKKGTTGQTIFTIGHARTMLKRAKATAAALQARRPKVSPTKVRLEQ